MNCKICHRPLSGRAYSLAVPTVASRRSSGNLTALAFLPYDPKIAQREGTVLFCGVRCSASALERYLQTGNLGIPNQHGEGK